MVLWVLIQETVASVSVLGRACLTGSAIHPTLGLTSERRGGAHMGGFSERLNTLLNWINPPTSLRNKNKKRERGGRDGGTEGERQRHRDRDRDRQTDRQSLSLLFGLIICQFWQRETWTNTLASYPNYYSIGSTPPTWGGVSIFGEKFPSSTQTLPESATSACVLSFCLLHWTPWQPMNESTQRRTYKVQLGSPRMAKL